MNKVDVNLYLHILALRTIGVTMRDIATDLGCSEHTVDAAEKWFAECPPAKAKQLISDAAVKALVKNELTGDDRFGEYLEAHPGLCSDDIFRRYEKTPQSETVVPESRYESRHQENMIKAATELRERLWAPAGWKIFNSDTCRFIESLKPETEGIMLGLADGRSSPVFEISKTPAGKLRVSGVKLGLERETQDDLFGHLENEEDFIAAFNQYEQNMAKEMGSAFNLIKRALADSRIGTKADVYVDQGDVPGINYSYPAYLCRFAMDSRRSPSECRFAILPGSMERWILVDKDVPSAALASGTKTACTRYQNTLEILMNKYMSLSAWSNLRRNLVAVTDEAVFLRKSLDRIIVRGYLNGSCPGCPDR